MSTTMHRLQISLPKWQVRFLAEQARREGESMAEIIRRLIQLEVDSSQHEAGNSAIWEIAGIAEAHYATIAPHLYCGPIEGAANIQIDTCSPNFLIQEGIGKWDGFHAEIPKEPIQWEDGYIIPPTKPGLGVELNEEVAARHPYIEVKDKRYIEV